MTRIRPALRAAGRRAQRIRGPIAGIGGITCAAALLAWLTLAALPPHLIPADAKDRAAAEADARTALLQDLAGGLVAIGLFLTWRTLNLNRHGQITDRFTKAIAQLGDDKLDVRLGGIYALERIARDSKGDHWTIMEVLTAFLREHASTDARPKLRTDLQAAATVLARRRREHEDARSSLDLRGVHLEKADLFDAHLEGALLMEAHLEDAFLVDSNLEQAVLTDATLEGALLERASLVGAMLTRANLEGARLADADLTAADLSEAFLARADLRGASLRNTDLAGADLQAACLAGADLGETNLTGAVASSETKWPESLDPASEGVHLRP